MNVRVKNPQMVGLVYERHTSRRIWWVYTKNPSIDVSVGYLAVPEDLWERACNESVGEITYGESIPLHEQPNLVDMDGHKVDPNYVWVGVDWGHYGQENMTEGQKQTQLDEWARRVAGC